jgi:hypothetical protein
VRTDAISRIECQKWGLTTGMRVEVLRPVRSAKNLGQHSIG